MATMQRAAGNKPEKTTSAYATFVALSRRLIAPAWVEADDAGIIAHEVARCRRPDIGPLLLA
jgi:hypothetical protein